MQAVAQREMDPGMNAEGSLQEMFEEHYSLVLNSAYRITGSLADAEDVLQTVFMRLARQTDLPRKGEDSRRYLRRAAVNTALDIIRRRKTGRRVPFESFEETLPGNHAARPDSLRSELELRAWLREALAGMNPRSAEVFTLKHLEGYSNREIAESLKTSPGVIAVTLHRTRLRLQKEIQAFLGEKP